MRPTSSRRTSQGRTLATRVLLSLALALGLAVAAGTTSASAASTLVFTEKTTSVTFVPAVGSSDPRGAGSVLITQGTLSKDGSAVGTVYVTCRTTRQVGTDYYGYCEESLVTGNGAIFAHGEINESALERYQAQSLQVYAGGGVYGGATGTLTVQQVVYPDTFTLTVALA